MRIVQVTRNGEVKLTVPAEVRKGILRHGDAILINADLIPPGEKDRVVAAIKAKQITPEIEAMGMRIGDNGNGLVCRWLDEVQAEQRAKMDAVRKPLPAGILSHTYTKRAIRDEGGKTVCIEHTITFAGGKTLQFSERNVFDFGRVINPMYAVAEGLEPGGLSSVRDGVQVWESFGVDKFRLPDGRIVEQEPAMAWALSTFPAGLPDGYTVSQREGSGPRFFADDPMAKYTVCVLGIPEAEQLWPGQGYQSTWDNVIEHARWNHAHNILKPLQIERAGWYVVRPLDGDEKAALKYLWENGYFAGHGCRMDTDEAVAENERAVRSEAALELACEEGTIPGAMPADL
jgi:hypothetical protein